MKTMPKAIDDLVQELDHTYEVRRSFTQGSANKATDAVVRQKQREEALAGDSRERELKEKYNLKAT